MPWVVQCIEPPSPSDYTGIERIVTESVHTNLSRDETPQEAHDRVVDGATYQTEYAGHTAELIPANPEDPEIERHVRTDESREELNLLNQPAC